MPLGVEGVKKTMGYLVKNDAKAFDPETSQLFDFDEWLEFATSDRPHVKSERLSVPVPEIIVLNTFNQKRIRKPRAISKRKVFQRDGNKCGYCGCSLNDENKTIDHIIPVSKKGSKSDYKNVVACCLSCNSKKGDKLLEEMGWSISHKLYSPEVNMLYHVPKSKQCTSWSIFLNN